MKTTTPTQGFINGVIFGKQAAKSSFVKFLRKRKADYNVLIEKYNRLDDKSVSEELNNLIEKFKQYEEN